MNKVSSDKDLLEGWIKTLLKLDIDSDKINRVLKREPMYNIGEKVDLVVYGDRKENIEVQDVKITYHPKLNIYCYGYKLRHLSEEDSGLTLAYIPESYLRKINNR